MRTHLILRALAAVLLALVAGAALGHPGHPGHDGDILQAGLPNALGAAPLLAMAAAGLWSALTASGRQGRLGPAAITAILALAFAGAWLLTQL